MALMCPSPQPNKNKNIYMQCPSHVRQITAVWHRMSLRCNARTDMTAIQSGNIARETRRLKHKTTRGDKQRRRRCTESLAWRWGRRAARANYIKPNYNGLSEATCSWQLPPQGTEASACPFGSLRVLFQCRRWLCATRADDPLSPGDTLATITRIFGGSLGR